MDKPLFDENDIAIFFTSQNGEEFKEKKESPELLEIEFRPDTQTSLAQTQEYEPLHPVKYDRRLPPLPPVPPPGALPKIQTSYAGHYNYERPSVFISVAKFLGIFVAIFILSFILLNGPALWKEFNYFTVTVISNKSYAAKTPTPIPTPSSTATLISAESKLIIPQIQVNAPIVWNVADENITQNLEKGVVHYKGTALPGQTGNIFITGHSSYYPWASGDYKEVFALLGKLQLNDKIYLQSNGKNYVYEVVNIKTVSPDDLSVLNATPTKTLTLMTCVPVGTNLRRLIVTANQIP